MGPPRTVPSVEVPDVRRLKTLRRKREGKENVRKEVTLETVLGVTATSNAGLATAPGSGMNCTKINAMFKRYFFN